LQADGDPLTCALTPPEPLDSPNYVERRVVIVIDAAVFRWANRVSEHLNENRMLMTEKVFGFLLAALAGQLALDGLADVGVIHLLEH
jgi:hypothetical protein